MDRSSENPISDPSTDSDPSGQADRFLGAEQDRGQGTGSTPPSDPRDRKLIFRRISGAEIGQRPPHFETTPIPTPDPDDEKSAELSGDEENFLDREAQTQQREQSIGKDLAIACDSRIDSAADQTDSDAIGLRPLCELSPEGSDHTRPTRSFDIDVRERPHGSRPRHRQRGESLRQGVVMMATVLGMLVAARFFLPGIVEEIRYAQHRGQLRAEFEVAQDGLQNVSLDTISQAYQMVSAVAGPSVVHIDIHRSDAIASSHPEILGAPSILISDQGSGVVVDSDGYILTNRHVVASSDEISVTLSDGRSVDATVMGTDEQTDLALLKISANHLMPIRWGDSERIRVGSPVWAIGSPFGLDRTVTFGILSGKHRVVRAKDRYQDFMQSDVAVNPGNSGGPLVDARGRMVGINTAIVGDTYQGVSFAIPSSVAKKVYEQLRDTGSVERGWLGVSLAEVSNDQLLGENHRVRGALIVSLADAVSGASRAGLRPGDIVTQVDGGSIRDVNHLMQVIGNAMAGTQVQLTVVRDDQEMKFDILLGRRPPEYSR